MATTIDYTLVEQMYQAYLRLDRHMVGVKVMKTNKAYEASNIKSYKGKSYYCQMVKKSR